MSRFLLGLIRQVADIFARKSVSRPSGESSSRDPCKEVSSRLTLGSVVHATIYRTRPSADPSIERGCLLQRMETCQLYLVNC